MRSPMRPRNGLKPDLFLKGGEKGAALTQAALKYASALANGYADPTKLHEVYTIPRPKVDVRQGLQQAIQKGDVKGWLASLAPQTDEYRALSQAHLRFLQARVQGAIPAGCRRQADQARQPRSAHSAGRCGAACGGLRRPAPQGRQAAAADAATDRYSPELVAAVKKLQGEFGFKPDGIIGGDTLDALNAGPGYRARQLGDRDGTAALAAARSAADPDRRQHRRRSFLDYWRDGQHVDHRKVVDGEPDKPTPQLQAPIVAWWPSRPGRCPKAIGEKEIADEEPGWLAGERFRA